MTDEHDKKRAWQSNEDTVQRGGVTNAVNTRRNGREDNPREYLERNREDAGEHHTCHPGCEHWEEEPDERTSRERLLDGETVNTDDL